MELDEVLPELPAPAEPPLPSPSFAKPFFFWLFAFALPLSFAASMLALVIHELAHGLTALVTGGSFVGIQGQFFQRGATTHAYADAWSDGYDGLVIAAGISVNVLLGILILLRARRTTAPLSRLVLFSLALVFLADLGYAFDGCIGWRTLDFDTALLLQEAGSPAVAWGVGIPVFVAMASTAFLVGRSLFRAWEEIFGTLRGGQAFWVIVFLVAPVPPPTVSMPGPFLGVGLSVGLFLVVTIWLIGTRRRDVRPVPVGSFSSWGWKVWAGAAAALVSAAALQEGIAFGTFRDRQLFDLHSGERSVIGLEARYGMGDRYGISRPVFDPRLFVATEEGIRSVPSPHGEILDLAWLPSSERFVLVYPMGLYTVDLANGESRQVWTSDAGLVQSAIHGPRGEIVAVVGASVSDAGVRAAIYVYDPVRNRGVAFATPGAAGYPVFVEGVPARALVTVGEDLWEFIWTGEGDTGIRREIREGASIEGWLGGVSGESFWWSEDEAWRSGSTRVSVEDAFYWGGIAEGVFVLDNSGVWQITSIEGDIVRSGKVEMDSILLVQFDEGLPWRVYEDGTAKPFGDGPGEYQVELPP